MNIHLLSSLMIVSCMSEHEGKRCILGSVVLQVTLKVSFASGIVSSTIGMLHVCVSAF